MQQTLLTPRAAVRAHQPQALEETLMIDLALLDESELMAISAAIVRQHLYPFPCRDTWREATSLVLRIFDELEARQRERRSTHERVDARYVSDEVLLEIYYELRREDAQVLPLCLGNDPIALAAYRDRYNLLADESKSWLIYRILKQRGVHIDVYFPGPEHREMSERDTFCPPREER
ncbi:hypothetical protein KDH_80280 [Dictyobacter sp. S3.2.2.5]|uniref:Uncharacterized protein n=1 Tax=Dictyobacter halimunensis TaxID=3026934 RepID=A0ABQ6G3W9_9CHLR|nr:hypothetical protein KDH_80280 [Dictyobacter sp. S3.2.2.5]